MKSLRHNFKRAGGQSRLRVALLACVGMSSAQALEIENLQVRFHDGEYRLTLTALLYAPLSQVQSVLRDYAAYPSLDTRILTAQVVQRISPTQLELFTRINVCFTFVCRKVERTERVEERPGDLLATVIPERSDAERGMTHTQLVNVDTRTRLIYTTQIVPKFWVPPLLGRALMLRNLRDATVSMFEHIEQRAALIAAPVTP